tara:strand:- start:517 stop:690 length:174 start_codon:yes stop_codon:yes gene_type:complete
MAGLILVTDNREMRVVNKNGGWTVEDDVLVLSPKLASQLGVILTTGIFDDETEHEDG